MRVWVDATTGTWGDVNDLRVVSWDMAEADLDMLEDMTDSERSEWAVQHGHPVGQG